MFYMFFQLIFDGKLILIIIFVFGIDLDNVQVQVQNCVIWIELKFLEEVIWFGIIVDKVLFDLIMVVYLILLDNCYDMFYLLNYVVFNVKDELVCFDGVGDVQLFGFGDYLLCVWLDLNKVVLCNFIVIDVVNVICEQNCQVVVGILGVLLVLSDISFQLLINIQGCLVIEEEFENIIICVGVNGEIICLCDIVWVELGFNQYVLCLLLNNKLVVVILIFQCFGLNVIEIFNLVWEKMVELKYSFL